MFEPVTLPLWALLLIGILAAWAFLYRLLVPGVRWYFRRKANRVIEELNKRLDLELPPLKLAQRRVLIDRLVYDPKVIEAVDAWCEENNALRDVGIDKARRYAREIVPNFNAYLYFRFGNWLSRRLVRWLYRMRMGHADEKAFASLDPKSSVVFVMNHRSNMDYILVAYLAIDRVALSYAVGEWARVWPLQQLIRSMGAYFVRRGGSNELYRRVLERYVALAVEGGIAQAVFPEGGLSRDGQLRPPKLGLLDYMVRDFDPGGERDILFVPVGINYDRVLEDRTLLHDRESGERRSGSAALRTAFGFIGTQLKLMMKRRWYRYGYACANFGEPVSLREFLAQRDLEPRELEREARFELVQELADDLMQRIGNIIPALPVSIACTVLLETEQPLTHDELRQRMQAMMERIENAGGHVYIPRKDRDYAVDVGLRMLQLRKLVDEQDGKVSMRADEKPLFDYYAAALDHVPRETA
ncbi:MAG: 1-acyl-sn-glycerol-3-phosphate acyltransferase [Gammaproteobacteria bacterium]|nr:1-acyl-sn-glycerol-3-phosphate acyltransferase [Gammaproteobacteria bacterium]